MAVSLTRSTPPPSDRTALGADGSAASSFHPARAGWSFVKPNIIPGFGLSLGYTIAYLSLIVLIPLAALFLKSASLSWEKIVAIAISPRTL